MHLNKIFAVSTEPSSSFTSVPQHRTWRLTKLILASCRQLRCHGYHGETTKSEVSSQSAGKLPGSCVLHDPAVCKILTSWPLTCDCGGLIVTWLAFTCAARVVEKGWRNADLYPLVKLNREIWQLILHSTKITCSFYGIYWLRPYLPGRRKFLCVYRTLIAKVIIMGIIPVSVQCAALLFSMILFQSCLSITSKTNRYEKFSGNKSRAKLTVMTGTNMTGYSFYPTEDYTTNRTNHNIIRFYKRHFSFPEPGCSCVPSLRNCNYECCYCDLVGKLSFFLLFSACK